MEITIDTQKLRNDLKDYYGTGAFNRFPAMMTEVWAIDRMSDQKVAQKAVDAGIDIFKYQV